jgi:hypothetical protein
MSNLTVLPKELVCEGFSTNTFPIVINKEYSDKWQYTVIFVLMFIRAEICHQNRTEHCTGLKC